MSVGLSAITPKSVSYDHSRNLGLQEVTLSSAANFSRRAVR